MKSYTVKITETLEKVVVISASSEEEARNIVEDDYKSEKHVLDYSNHTITEFVSRANSQ